MFQIQGYPRDGVTGYGLVFVVTSRNRRHTVASLFDEVTHLDADCGRKGVQ